jgi:nickel superoxide dismutase
MKKRYSTVLCIVFLFLLKSTVFPHCEIPCGIYNDEMRLEMIMEHIQTIEKSIKEIQHLSNETASLNYNQLVRWITNKEHHAEEIQHIISQYFLTQRIKPNELKETDAQERYMNQLSLCHKIMVLSMKTKQSLELSNVEELKKTVVAFKSSYLDSK